MSGELQPGDVFAKDFLIERKLSRGGMGAVYVARQLSTDKLRALKLMLPQLAPDAKSRQRFIDEARIGGRIDSEHVVEVVAAGIDESSGAPWLAMELLEGEDLGSLSARRGPLPVGEVRELFLQAGHALGLAHAKGIVHRDLKPENLFLARARRQGQASVVKVLDFGIALALPTGGAGVVTTAVGSPFWMAPEQAKPGAPLTPATDVWALGLIAFQMLTGGSYWKSAKVEDASIGAVLTEILVEPIALASARAAELGLPALPARFDEWFACCVTRTATERFIDASSCLQALDALLEPVAPRAPVNFSNSLPEAVVEGRGLDETHQRATPFPARDLPTAESRAPGQRPAVSPASDAPAVAAPPPAAPAPVSAPPVAAPAPPATSRVPVALIVGVVGLVIAVGAIWTRPTPASPAPVAALTPPSQPEHVAPPRSTPTPAPAPTAPPAPKDPPPAAPAPTAMPTPTPTVPTTPANTPTPTAPPTPAPTAPPTPAPTAPPTPAPTATPTPAPTAPPTSVPTATPRPAPTAPPGPVPPQDPAPTQAPAPTPSPVVTSTPAPAPVVAPTTPPPTRAPKPQSDFAIERVRVVRGDGCRSGRGVTVEEARAHTNLICDLIGQWSIVRLAGGGSMDGRGYQCKVRPNDPRGAGESLCLQ